MREHFNGMYRVDVYYLCKVLVDVPTFIVLPLVFITISYWMIGLHSDLTAFFIAAAVIILVTNAAVSFGYLISCAAGTENLALALAPTCIIPLMLFGGFFLNSGTVPKYFMWLAVSSHSFSRENSIDWLIEDLSMDRSIDRSIDWLMFSWSISRFFADLDISFQYISWFKYGNEALAVNQWSRVSNITCNGSVSCPRDGPAILRQLNFHEENLTFDIGMLFVLIVAFRILAFVALAIRARRKWTPEKYRREERDISSCQWH